MPTKEKIKVHLLQAILLPILQYPLYPLITLSKTRLKTLQTTQNKAIRFVTNHKHPHAKITKKIHEENKLKTLNIILLMRTEDIRKKKIINQLQIQDRISI